MFMLNAVGSSILEEAKVLKENTPGASNKDNLIAGQVGGGVKCRES